MRDARNRLASEGAIGSMALFSLLLCCLFCSGCASHAQKIAQSRSNFFANDLITAESSLANLSSREDRDVIQLDLAMVELFSGKVESAEKRLREVRDRFDAFEQNSILESAASLWIDDRATSYAGEDYEKVFIRVMLALSSLVRDSGDAESYAHQINVKQRELAETAEQRFGKSNSENYSQLPIGHYLSAVLSEMSWRDYDDALAAYRRAANELTEHPQILADIQRVTTTVPSQPDHGVLYVFALTGRGPLKVERVEQATSDALLLADQIISATSDQSLPPTIAPVKVPVIALEPMEFDSIGVDINGIPAGQTIEITDFGELAVNAYEAKRDRVMAETIARRIVKKATVYAAKESIEADGAVSIAMDLIGSAWEATEVADTRCWGILPQKIQMFRIELPVGEHVMALKPTVNGHAVGGDQTTKIEIRDGEATFALGFFPGTSAVGECLVGPNL